MADNQYRGLLTNWVREIIKGEANVSDNYRYRVVSRVRAKIKNVSRDIEILSENRGDLLEEFQETVCENN